jgi:acyl-CoA synthetase (AMP-forming)/AMP-acid ligase II
LAYSAQRHGRNWPGKILLRSARQQVAPHLRLLVSGGAAIDVEVEKTLDALGWEMLTGYGLVETSSMLTFNPPGAALPGSGTAPLIREIALLGQNGALVALVVPDLAAARDSGALRLGEAIREGLAAKARVLPSYARLSGFGQAEKLPAI